MNRSLAQLVLQASKVRMTERERTAQRVSFAYGTAKIENDNVTREMVERAARRAEGAKVSAESE